MRVSAAVMGIEFSYAAETAFVSPTLLKIGVDHQHMTLVWALSPLVGFFVTPLLGSLSDRCRLKQGRRRPFILLLAIGVFMGEFLSFHLSFSFIFFSHQPITISHSAALAVSMSTGLILVPNGEDLGYAMGDVRGNYSASFIHRTSAKIARDDGPLVPSSHSWGIFFTILGTVLLDFDADACQSPARAYLLDVTLPGEPYCSVMLFFSPLTWLIHLLLVCNNVATFELTIVV